MSDFRTPYLTYDVLDKWDSPSWNEQTRDVVRKRLEEVPTRRFLSEDQWSLLEAIVARLIPQPDREEPVPIVPWIDDMLHHNHTPATATPTCRRCARRGARGSTRSRPKRATGTARTSRSLSPEEQDELLADVQNNRVEQPLLGRPAGGRLLHSITC